MFRILSRRCNYPEIIKPSIIRYSSASKGGKRNRLEGITFQRPIPASRFNEVVDHMRTSFYVNEPLLASLELSKPGQPLPEMDEYLVQIMKEGYSSIAALDSQTDKVVAVVMHRVLRASDPDDYAENLDKKQGKLKLIFELIYKSNLHLDLFCRYGVDEIFEIKMLSVNANYLRRGLARELMRRSDDLCKDAGFKVAKAHCTGFYSQRLLASFGFEKIHVIKYSCYRDKEKNVIFKIAPPHDSLAVMVKQQEICEKCEI